MSNNSQYWTIWYPKAAATGLLLLRAQIDPTDTVLVHAVGDEITVEVSDSNGSRLAFGKDLERTQESPMCRLRREGDRITREDIWPVDHDLGSIVLLPGGEAGKLQSWWHAENRREWRWHVEFYNSLD